MYMRHYTYVKFGTFLRHPVFCADTLWPWLGLPLAALRYGPKFDVYECLVGF